MSIRDFRPDLPQSKIGGWRKDYGADGEDKNSHSNLDLPPLCFVQWACDILRLSPTELQCKGCGRAFDSKPDREEGA